MKRRARNGKGVVSSSTRSLCRSRVVGGFECGGQLRVWRNKEMTSRTQALTIVGCRGLMKPIGVNRGAWCVSVVVGRLVEGVGIVVEIGGGRY